MNGKTESVRTRLYLAAAVTLVAGLGCAAVLYLQARDEPADRSLQEFHNSKKYIRSLELYGGKMAVMEDEISRWYDSLWHGKRLAGTVACIAFAVSGALALAARHLVPDPAPDAPDDQEQIRT